MLKDEKITMLGASGAGKTCYMIGMYSVMCLGHKGFTFSCDEDVDLGLREHWLTMIEGGDSRWPPQTANNPIAYDFCFNYGFRPMLKFGWLDYRGGAMGDRSTESDVQALLTHLRESACIMLCVSGEHLTPGRPNSVIAAKAGIGRMNVHLKSLRAKVADSGKELPPVVIVITKYDHCRNRDKEELLNQLRELFSPLFASGEDWLVGICPVSLGVGLASDPKGGEMGPYNLHLPVAFATYCLIERKYKETEKRVSCIKEQRSRLGSNAIKRWWNSEEIDGLFNDIEMNSNDLQKMRVDMGLMIQELKGMPTFHSGKAVEIDV